MYMTWIFCSILAGSGAFFVWNRWGKNMLRITQPLNNMVVELCILLKSSSGMSTGSASEDRPIGSATSEIACKRLQRQKQSPSVELLDILQHVTKMQNIFLCVPRSHSFTNLMWSTFCMVSVAQLNNLTRYRVHELQFFTTKRRKTPSKYCQCFVEFFSSGNIAQLISQHTHDVHEGTICERPALHLTWQT